MKERAQWKAQFRNEAMKLFEADYPQQLVTEMRRTERRKEQYEKTQTDEEMRRKVELMYELVKLVTAQKNMRHEQESWQEKAGEKGVRETIF